MIIALFIYLGAHVGLISAPPAVINFISIGSVIEQGASYAQGRLDGPHYILSIETH